MTRPPRPAVTALVCDPDHRATMEARLDARVPFYSSARELLADGGVEPGAILIGPGVELGDALQVASDLARREQAWIVVHVDRRPDGELVARVPSVGRPQPLDEVLEATGPGGSGVLLELETVLELVAKARHDINNPLTTMLAETQLLLMDVEDGEVRESLEAIERQVRRVRDLVAELAALRPPETP